ncbi:MAG: KAP family NTPase [Intrasporangium sp.]|uniref:KAP family P-loop NTPase fold protein n=1 Tax=Intrasporangium sp. TaxID=1925024 RepID=UPI002647E4B0|nr:P-loop NTPase fold protein [Intrasporangium sp.]MDN5797782.1 KAP family NTPase [Intrasporangium sp.]
MTTNPAGASLAGQLWSDEPAEVDLLAARAIAETVADAILDDVLDPLSLGLSGPWGSGKTTVLELIGADLEERSNDESKVLVVRTDPWRYDPSVGAKESIIADILDGLAAELKRRPETATSKAAALVKRLAKRVDWAKALKLAATTAVALQIPSVEQVTGLIKDPDSGEEAGEPRGLAGFHAEFKQLMSSEELAHVCRVAVLVDDLDRCLSRTVVETLEAMRLFLSVPRMAFIIAADEDRVADAIKAELPEWEMPKERPGTLDALPPEPPWKLYLHKIVQTTVPLPALGAFDTESYLLLLQVQNRTTNPFSKDQLQALIAECGRLRTSGALDGLNSPDNIDVQHELAFAHRLTAILYEKFAGNPRRIKRFLNDMNVRRIIAARRGIVLDADVVAKMMVLEVLLPEQFTEVLSWLRTGELRDRLSALEQVAQNANGDGTSNGGGAGRAKATEGAAMSTKATASNIIEAKGQDPETPAGADAKKRTPSVAAKKSSKATTKTAVSSDQADEEKAGEGDGTAPTPSVVPDFGDDLIRWAKLEPPLADIGLSPYLHLAASFSGDLLVSEELPQRLRDLVHQLNVTGPLGKQTAEEKAARLPVEDARILIRFFARRARDRAQEQRGAVTAIGRLATAHATLSTPALEAFRRLPAEDLQVPTAMYLKALDLDGIDDVTADLATRATGAVKNALTTKSLMGRNR